MMDVTLSKQRHELFILVGSVMLYHLVVGLQGFDMADEGWSMTGFQQIFNDPQSVEYLFLYYLTNIVGGVWNVLFGWGGIYAFRVLTAIFMTLTVCVVWRMLRPHFSFWSIMAGIWASFFCSYYGIMVFYHNYLTAFLAVCSAAALYKALVSDDLRWMAASGFIIGCNVFVRLPNLSLTSLILLLLPYYLYHRNARRTGLHCCSAMGGFLLGAGSMVLLMLALGHLGIFTNAVGSGFSATSDCESNHQFSQMVRRYLSVYKTIFTIGFFNNLYSVYLFGTLGWLWIMLFRRSRREYVYLSTTAVIILHCLPLGSDYGVTNIGENCVYLATPLLTAIIWKEIDAAAVSNRSRSLLRTSTIVLLCLFFARGGKQIMGQCYFDEGSRVEKTHLIDHPLATTFTTLRNCHLLNPLLRELSRHISKDDYLLCFQNNPTIHFLTQTRPYLYNPWVWAYDPSNMEQHFKRAEREHNVLPVIVRDKSLPPYWYEYDPDWDNEHAENTYFHKNKKIHLIRAFIRRHHYQLVWENEVFQVLISTATSANASNSLSPRLSP